MWRIKIKIALICLRHGINPFATIVNNTERMKQRFTPKEKQWLINNVSEHNKEYFKRLFPDIKL